MRQLGELLVSHEGFEELVIGNTAIVRAMVESGTRVVTSYPGSPTPEIAQAIASIPLEKRPFYFEFSANEKVATEVALGASLNGHPSAVFFKSVGLNVASDAFVQLGHLELLGGMVVILGDDPGANSSQNEQDNRHFARLSYTPLLEPATAAEAYAMYKEAARLARERRMPVLLRLTTHVCHAKEKVRFAPFTPAPRDDTPRFDRANGPYIPIAAEVFPMKRRALAKLEAFREWAEASPLTTSVDHGNAARGVITAGLPFQSLLDALEPVAQKPDVLKLGVVYPLPKKAVAAFLRAHREVKVLEELDDFLEQQIKALAFEEQIPVRVLGKADSEEWLGEYTPEKVEAVLRRAWPDLLPAPTPRLPECQVPKRPPQMCPGCGHRSAFHAIKKALAAQDITVGDIGCHTLGFLPPHQMGEVVLCMGASLGVGAGLSLFNTSRRVVAFIGDSTFFHAGLPGVVNALFNRHHLTLVLLENGTTAMTGHQDHPGSGKNFNEITDKIPLKRVLEGLGVTRIYECDAYQQEKLVQLMHEATAGEGFSVVIAKHPCMLKLVRDQRRKKADFATRHVLVDAAKCEKLRDCVERFGCPSFVRTPDGGAEVNLDLCIGDGSCIQTCPVKAIRY